MNKIRLSSLFLKNGLAVLLVLVALTETLSWSLGYEGKWQQVKHAGGLLAYCSILVRNLLLPEIITILILTGLMEGTRRWFKLTTVDTTWLALGRYELSFLPVMVVAFALFSPFTQTARYLLMYIGTYSLSDYWTYYMVGAYSWEIYFRYLTPVLFVGYCTLNLSLLADYVKQDRLSMSE